jgi:hypothetical protein
MLMIRALMPDVFIILCLALLSGLALSSEEVVISSTKTSIKRAESHVDLKALYDENLMPDFASYTSSKEELSVNIFLDMIDRCADCGIIPSSS